jgi:hypothetical protein
VIFTTAADRFGLIWSISRVSSARRSTLIIEAGELPPNVKPWTRSVEVYVEGLDARIIERGLHEASRGTMVVDSALFFHGRGMGLRAGG